MLIFCCFLITLAAALYVAAPLRPAARGAGGIDAPAVPIDLLAERDELQEELSNLEFDRRMEKLDDSDYQELREGTAAQAGAVLRDIGSRSAPTQSATTGIAGLLHLDAEAEILIARAKFRLARWQCPNCRRSMASADAFCASCATPRPPK